MYAESSIHRSISCQCVLEAQIRFLPDHVYPGCDITNQGFELN